MNALACLPPHSTATPGRWVSGVSIPISLTVSWRPDARRTRTVSPSITRTICAARRVVTGGRDGVEVGVGAGDGVDVGTGVGVGITGGGATPPPGVLVALHGHGSDSQAIPSWSPSRRSGSCAGPP